jgi:hypothetical protein
VSEAIAARDDEGTRRRGGIRWERADAVAVARRDARRDAQRSRHSRTTRSGRPSDRARRAPRGIGGGRARSGAGREGGIWARGPFDARRTWRRTFATKRGSPLDATDFSSSATFAKSCREERAGGGGGGRGRGDGDGQAPARRTSTTRAVDVGTSRIWNAGGRHAPRRGRRGASPPLPSSPRSSYRPCLSSPRRHPSRRAGTGEAEARRGVARCDRTRRKETNKPPSPPSASKF